MGRWMTTNIGEQKKPRQAYFSIDTREGLGYCYLCLDFPSDVVQGEVRNTSCQKRGGVIAK